MVELIVISRLFVASGVVAAALLSPFVTMPAASAEPCPDVELVFARGTFEAPGVGGTGQAFVDSLQFETGRKVPGRVSGELSGVAGFPDGF